MNEEWLAEALEAAVDARFAYEDNPSPERDEDYQVARSVFRTRLIKEQRDALQVLRAKYFGMAGNLKLVWQEMATIDSWLRSEGLDSPLPKDFIESVRLPALSQDLNDLVCGTEAGYTHFDFERVYSETAKKVFDGTFWAYPGEYEKP